MRFTTCLFATTLAVGCAAPDDDGTEHVLAHIERTTADGKDHYTFEFVEADGAIATLIGSPLGYPRFETRGCVLDTYLRVAPDDAIVPVELRRACAVPGSPLDPAPMRVHELRAPGTAFEPPPLQSSVTTGPYCGKDGYESRFQALLAAAKQVAKKKVEYEVCDLIYTNDQGGCRVWVAEPNLQLGKFAFACDPFTTPPGSDCWSSHPESTMVPNSACEHSVVSWGTYGPWLDWEQVTPYGVSQLQAEVSSCTPNSTTVFYWQVKRSKTTAWSGTHTVVLGGPAYWIFQLSSGTNDGDWAGAKYLVHANGPGVFPMMAGTLMEGQDHSDCPTGLFL